MTAMLASVTRVAEALQCLDAGVDVIDLKNPAAGAIGALPVETISEIVAHVAGRRAVSATAGDLPMVPAQLCAAAAMIAAAGVDFVKLGFFGNRRWEACIAALSPLARQGARLIAVLFADQQPNLEHLRLFARAGFAGIMLDTADKAAGTLLEHMPLSRLAVFVHSARSLGLLTGLAGSLRRTDIPLLLPLQPDYLGFRGALCEGTKRDNALVADLVRAVRATMSEKSSVERVAGT